MIGMPTMRVPSEDELVRAEEQLSREGYAILPSLMDPATCDDISGSLQQLHDAQSFGVNDFTGTRTKRVFNLFAKTRALDQLVVEPSVLRLTRSRLGPEAQLSIASTMEIHDGETPQALHQDDAYFPDHPHPTLVINTIWALTDFTEANGATRLVPGSHLLPDVVNDDAATRAAEMPRGSVLLWDGAVWHGGGSNTTDAARFGLSLNYCRGWIRQQENQYLALAPDVVASLPDDVQKILGYDVCQFVGWVDGRHPQHAIGPAARSRVSADLLTKNSV